MFLSRSDRIEVFQRCITCLGQKVVKDETGNTSECPACQGTGETSKRVTLHDLVDFIGEEMVSQIRLQGGLR